MDKMNKILYCILVFFVGWLMKLLSDRIVPGIVELILCFIGVGFLIQLVECIFDIIKLESDSDGNVSIPKGFFDFL
jgi:TM2 domain-containing membrane protein YozV